MPVISPAKPRRRNGRAAIVVIFVLVLGLTGCTRDDVAGAIAGVAGELRATLVPFGEAARDSVEAIGTQIPAAYATAKAPTSTPVTETALPTPTLRLMTQTTSVVAQTETPLPTLTNPPSPTATLPPTETATIAPKPTPTAMPAPAAIDVPGGSMTLILGGPFQMGAAAEFLAEECNTFRAGCRPEWFAASEPIHTVQLDRFYIDTHEVTNAAYLRFLNEMGGDALCLGQSCINTDQSHLASENGTYIVPGYLELRPVAGVTWYGAAAYCEWRGARLPTEAEWEKAAAWDDATATARLYPWGDTFDGRLVNFCDAACTAPHANLYFFDGYAETSPVTYFENGRGPYGLFDMAGNVWEWVSDWYDPNYYAQSPGENPIGPEEGVERVVRGGSWYDTGNFTASAIRFPSPPNNTDSTIGFRCAADAP